jgi:hypothetical protein
MRWLKSHQNLFFAVVLISALTGCNRGCTTQSTLDSESKTISICGQEATVTVRFIESRHSRRVAGGELFERNVSYNYGLAFDLETQYWTKQEIMYEPWPAEEDPDLDLQIERFKATSSANQLHFAFGMDEDLYGVYHVIGTHAFPSTLQRVGLQLDAKLESVQFKRMESPESILYGLVNSGFVCMLDADDEANIQAIFDQLEPTGRIPMLALEKWPECRILNQYYSDEKVAELGQNQGWKQAAIDRCFGVLKSDKESFLGGNDALEMLRALDDDVAYHSLDTFYAASWGDNMSHDANNYIFERLVSQDRPMQLSVRELLVRRADEAVQAFYETGDDQSAVKLHRCIHLYLLLAEEEKVNAFLEYSYAEDHFGDSFFEIEASTFDNFYLYSEQQQELILEQSRGKIKGAKSYHRESIYDQLKEHVSCDILGKLLADYPEDLKYSELPDRCAAQ